MQKIFHSVFVKFQGFFVVFVSVFFGGSGHQINGFLQGRSGSSVKNENNEFVEIEIEKNRWEVEIWSNFVNFWVFTCNVVPDAILERGRTYLEISSNCNAWTRWEEPTRERWKHTKLEKHRRTRKDLPRPPPEDFRGERWCFLVQTQQQTTIFSTTERFDTIFRLGSPNLGTVKRGNLQIAANEENFDVIRWHFLYVGMKEFVA